VTEGGATASTRHINEQLERRTQKAENDGVGTDGINPGSDAVFRKRPGNLFEARRIDLNRAAKAQRINRRSAR